MSNELNEFPQMNVGIECDEAYHEKNTEPDKIREVNVEQALSALQTGKDFKLIRINANTDMDEFEKQINNAVDEIKYNLNKGRRRGDLCFFTL